MPGQKWTQSWSSPAHSRRNSWRLGCVPHCCLYLCVCAQRYASAHTWLLPLPAECDILPVMLQHPQMRACTSRLPAEHAPGSSTVFKQVSGRHDVAIEQATGQGLRVTLQVQSKSVCVQILENTIKYRWGALPDEQREGVKNYITNLIIKLSSDEAAFRREKTTLNKLNIILVQVLKQVRPQTCGSDQDAWLNVAGHHGGSLTGCVGHQASSRALWKTHSVRSCDCGGVTWTT